MKLTKLAAQPEDHIQAKELVLLFQVAKPTLNIMLNGPDKELRHTELEFREVFQQMEQVHLDRRIILSSQVVNLKLEE
ncbi:hypothetical protein MJO28_011025 [Puccinia striiformis f. sp. tritici]|uniref:Uncharacterized protein n=1 Tax=Puccinia striiformis f. sp. tritici TaxID=168172 RepID=A0ACC0E1J4_9BASI|nr:hypothetical protein MJO28_011025 [Puccinia striiformis f. sp. tritici]